MKQESPFKWVEDPKPEPRPESREEKEARLADLRKRREELKGWVNSWTSEDRDLDDRLASQIDELEREIAA